MKTFRQFLFESDFEEQFYKGRLGKRHSEGFVHDTRIGDRNLSIGFSRVQGEKHGYHVDFAVDEDYGKHTSSNSDDIKVLHHVKRKVSDFIAEKRPSYLGFKPFDPDKGRMAKKDHIYHKVAEHLAKKHNGKHHWSKSEDGSHTLHVISFDKGLA